MKASAGTTFSVVLTDTGKGASDDHPHLPRAHHEYQSSRLEALRMDSSAMVRLESVLLRATRPPMTLRPSPVCRPPTLGI